MNIKKGQSKTRDNVISVRLDDTSIQAIDLLVQAGLAQSRSEGAAQLIVLGIRSADDLLQQASNLAVSVQRIKNEMIEAVKSRNVKMVQELLTDDENLINAQNEKGETAVMMATYYHAKEIRDMLLAKGPTLDLFEACAVGHTERVETILASELESVNVHNTDGYTPLGLSAFFGHLETVKFLLVKGANVHQLSRDGQFNNTALHAAIAGNYKDIVQVLLEQNADVNARSKGSIRAGFTPLHVAAGRGKKEIISLLLEYGANSNARNDDGLTPSEYALQLGFTEISNCL